MTRSKALPLLSEADVITARAAGRELAQELGFGIADQTRLATAISELARNAVSYGETGLCTIVDDSNNAHLCIRIVVEDKGPGIADTDLALTDGFSTNRSLGAGLPGAKRLVDEFDIESQPGHTRVAISMSRARPVALDGEDMPRRQSTARGSGRLGRSDETR